MPRLFLLNFRNRETVVRRLCSKYTEAFKFLISLNQYFIDFMDFFLLAFMQHFKPIYVCKNIKTICNLQNKMCLYTFDIKLISHLTHYENFAKYNENTLKP